MIDVFTPHLRLEASDNFVAPVTSMGFDNQSTRISGNAADPHRQRFVMISGLSRSYRQDDGHLDPGAKEAGNGSKQWRCSTAHLFQLLLCKLPVETDVKTENAECFDPITPIDVIDQLLQIVFQMLFGQGKNLCGDLKLPLFTRDTLMLAGHIEQDTLVERWQTTKSIIHQLDHRFKIPVTLHLESLVIQLREIQGVYSAVVIAVLFHGLHPLSSGEIRFMKKFGQVPII